MEKKKYHLIFALIILLAVILRLGGFNNHFLLGSDTARDILTARGAVTLGQLPWVGSFSSAGPFVFGPNWYWFLMLPAILVPGLFLGPWILMFLISLFFVVAMGLVGRSVGGKKLGLIMALLTAVSPLAISNSLYLTQHGTIQIFSALALLGLLLYLKTGKLIFAFLMGAAIGGGFSMHYQAINLFVYFPVAFLGAILQRKTIRDLAGFILATGLGAIIFPLPLFLWDAARGFKNIEQLIYFFRVGQYRFWVSNRWLTYLGVFWPGFLGKTIGGGVAGGLAVGLSIGIAFFFALIKKKLSLAILAVAAIGLIQLVMLRYLRTEKYDGYLIYFHPILLTLVGWTIFQIVKLNRLVGLFLFTAALVLSMRANVAFYQWNNDAANLYAVSQKLQNLFGDEKVFMYGRSLSSSNVSYSLSAVLDSTGVGAENGRPIGVCLYEITSCATAGAVEIMKGKFQGDVFIIADLGSVPGENLSKQNDWYPFSKLAVYDDVQNWWRKGL